MQPILRGFAGGGEAAYAGRLGTEDQADFSGHVNLHGGQVELIGIARHRCQGFQRAAAGVNAAHQFACGGHCGVGIEETERLAGRAQGVVLEAAEHPS